MNTLPGKKLHIKSAIYAIINFRAGGKSSYFTKSFYVYVNTSLASTVKLEILFWQLAFFVRKYTFYLSLENAFCEDYLTEKFFAALGMCSSSMAQHLCVN
jgi:hypothetical protein